MAWQVTSLVLARTVGPSVYPEWPAGAATRKLVLFTFADHANEDGTGSWPALRTVARAAECSPRQASRAIQSLVADGYLIRRSAASGGAGSGRSAHYDVSLSVLMHGPVDNNGGQIGSSRDRRHLRHETVDSHVHLTSLEPPSGYTSLVDDWSGAPQPLDVPEDL